MAAWRAALPPGSLQGKTVVDVGCGLGALSLLAAKASGRRRQHQNTALPSPAHSHSRFMDMHKHAGPSRQTARPLRPCRRARHGSLAWTAPAAPLTPRAASPKQTAWMALSATCTVRQQWCPKQP
jgi:hypothetical protein